MPAPVTHEPGTSKQGTSKQGTRGPGTYEPGSAVRVRDDWPEQRGPCHIRTPHYLRGRTGRIVRHLGDFPNPEDLAFARPAARLPLYHVAFAPQSVWPDAGGSEILVELYEPWLEPA